MRLSPSLLAVVSWFPVVFFRWKPGLDPRIVDPGLDLGFLDSRWGG